MSKSIDPNAVTDSTDWLETPLPGLAPLESSLRCQVCKEVFTTPMITSCSHTFCSLCIRRYLSQEGKCPSCRTPDQEMKLRHNWAVQELVEIWSENRDKIFAFARSAGVDETREEDSYQRPKKRRKVEEKPVVVQKGGLSERRSTRIQTRRAASQASQSISSLPATQEEVPNSDDDDGSVYDNSPKIDNRHFPSTEPNDGLVGCPNCTRRIKEALINVHLDKCLQGLPASPTPPPPAPATSHGQNNHGSSPSRTLQSGTIAYTTTKPANASFQRLPTINYSINESALRRKLKDLGIPNQGTKEQMRKRHSEWMNLWNANCDSLHPVPKAKLLRELDVWEKNAARDERARLPQGGATNGSGSVMEKEFDRERYMRKEKEGFEDLVRKARESRQAKAAAKADAVAPVEAAPGGVNTEDADDRARVTTAGASPLVNGSIEPVAQYTPAASLHDDVTMTNGDSLHDEQSPSSVKESVPMPTTLVPNTPPRPKATGKPPMFAGDGATPEKGATITETIDLVTPEKAQY